MTQTKPENQIDYIELPVKDMAATKQFYGAVFGWKFEDYGPDYSSFFDGRLAGGFTIDRTSVTQGPLIVLYSSNLEAMQQKVETAGGKIVKPIFSFPGGRRFQFTDPSGNELSVWSDAG